MKSVAIIPARGGSKRIPRKNIKLFFDKPIISYSIEAAIKSGLFDEVMVSTDDHEIAEISKKIGANVPFLRSDTNANDYATTVDVIKEVLNAYSEKFDIACCIYPTAPLLQVEKLKEGYVQLIEGGFDTVFHAIEHAWGGEIFIPKIPSYKILDVAEAIGPDCEKKVIGIRPGEKLHEEMITSSDSFFTYDLGTYYVILPSQPVFNLEQFITDKKAKKVPEGFTYNSGENTEWETVDSLKRLIKEHVDPLI